MADRKGGIHAADTVGAIFNVNMLQVAGLGGIFEAQAWPQGGGIVFHKADAVSLGAIGSHGSRYRDLVAAHDLDKHSGLDIQIASGWNRYCADYLIGAIGQSPGSGLIATHLGGQTKGDAKDKCY